MKLNKTMNNTVQKTHKMYEIIIISKTKYVKENKNSHQWMVQH